MQSSILIILLVVVTFGSVLGLALWSKKAAERKLQREDGDKSSLAKDGPGPNPNLQ